MTLKDKTVLITGCNRGIGKAILEEFAKNRAKIFAHARNHSPEYASMLQDTSEKYGVEIIPLYFDMTDFQAMKEEIKNKIFKTKISIDVLVNSAGVSHGAFFVMTPIKKIKEVFEINLFSQMELTQLILKSMLREKRGSIINIGSITGLDLPPATSSYGVAKAALMAWTKTLSLEVGSSGIRVNSIAPGIIDAGMGNIFNPEASEKIIQASALKRLGKPQEVAKLAVFLADDDSSYLTGQVIRIDGGQYDR